MRWARTDVSISPVYLQNSDYFNAMQYCWKDANVVVVMTASMLTTKGKVTLAQPNLSKRTTAETCACSLNEFFRNFTAVSS